MSGVSRKRRILNLALRLDKISDDPTTCSNEDEEISKQESAAQRNTNTSPLPPAAQNIDVDMAEIWHDVFDENDHTNVLGYRPEVNTDTFQANCEHLDSPPPHLLQTSHLDEVLTPLNIEVTSSFNNSPAVYIEEFEDPGISTPSSSHMVLATPMPSPVNIHIKCNDPFCPDHTSWVDSIQSLNISASNLIPEMTQKQRSKKRLVHKQDWSDVKRKSLTNLGKSYVSKRGKFVGEKIMGKPCSCRNNCVDKITKEQRLECFNTFWMLGSREKQWSYVAKYVNKTVKNRCLNRSTPNNRQYTFKYFLPIILSGRDKITVNVCKKMFLQTLAVSENIIKTTFQKYDGVANIEEDCRGKHKHHYSVLNNDMIKSVCDHINSFVPVESHFIRKDSNKLYLDGSLSISRIYKLYNEWFDETVYTTKAKTARQYREIVNKNYNLGFHIPKKDQCEVCHIYRNNPEPTSDDKKSYEDHVNAKKTARNIKQRDKQDALESQGSVVAAVFDFQKILNCPHGKISIFYYKRKLSVLNFTVFNMAEKKSVCYMWDETVAKRGANEVSSCLLDYIQYHVEQGAKELRFWSDNCAGQNRNRFVFFSYLYAAKKYKVSITHRFLEKGHTQNEGDSVHALIERSSSSKTIYTPDEWRLLVRWAKTEGEPYVVKNMTQEIFFNFKVHVNDKLWNKNFRQQKILWTKIKEVFVDKSEPNKLYYKYDLNQETYECLIVRSDTRNSANILPVLEYAYSSPLKLTKAKYKDLVSMCDSGVIKSCNAVFFKSLPYYNSDCNDERNDIYDDES